MRRKRIKNKHLDSRMCRTGSPLSKYEIQDEISKGNYQTAMRVSHTRRLIYTSINGYNIKAIIEKRNKSLITILPMRYCYSQQYDLNYGGHKYQVTIFPDCYMECNDNKKMTTVKVFKDNEWISIIPQTTLHNILFRMSWYYYINVHKQALPYFPIPESIEVYDTFKRIEQEPMEEVSRQL